MQILVWKYFSKREWKSLFYFHKKLKYSVLLTCAENIENEILYPKSSYSIFKKNLLDDQFYFPSLKKIIPENFIELKRFLSSLSLSLFFLFSVISVVCPIEKFLGPTKFYVLKYSIRNLVMATIFFYWMVIF